MIATKWICIHKFDVFDQCSVVEQFFHTIYMYVTFNTLYLLILLKNFLILNILNLFYKNILYF